MNLRPSRSYRIQSSPLERLGGGGVGVGEIGARARARVSPPNAYIAAK